MHSFLKFVAWFLKAALVLVALAAVVLFFFLDACATRVPEPLARMLEDKLCTEAFCIRFDTVAFSLRSGITFNRARLYARGVIGPPLVAVDQLHASTSFRLGRPIAESVDSITLRGLDFAELPDFDQLGDLIADAAEDAQYEPDANAYAWLTRPIDLNIVDFNLLGTRIDSLSTRAALHGRVFHFDDMRLRWAGADWPEYALGEFSHDQDLGAFRFTLEGYATPTPLYSLFGAIGANGIIEVCNDFSDFHSPLETKFDLRKKDSNSILEVTLSLRGSDFRYLDIPISRARAEVTYSEGGVENLVRVKGLVAECPVGTAAGDLEVNPEGTEISLALSSSVPIDVITTVAKLEPDVESNILASLSFDVPPSMVVSGVASIVKDDPRVSLRGRINATHSFIVAGVPVSSAEGDFILTEKSVDFPGLVASAFGGSVTGDVHLAEIPGTTNNEWSVHGVGVGSRLSFGDFCRDVLLYTNNFGGTLDGTFDLSAPLELRAFPTGYGHAEVRNGTIARIPLFAGFTDYLAANIPGVESMVTQSDITLDFTCTNRQFRTENLLVEGGFFSMRASGRYRDTDRTLDFTAKARLFKEKTIAGILTRIVTFPFSKLLEFRVYGTADSPEWSYIGILDRVIDIFAGDSKEEEQ